MMDILLIQPAEFFSGVSSTINVVPTHFLLLGSCLKNDGINIEMLPLADELPDLPSDLRELALYYDKLIAYLLKYKDIGFVGISCYSMNFYVSTIIVAYAVRQAIPDATIFVGGYGPNTVTEDFIFENAPFDYIFLGEADIELGKLIKKIAGKPASERSPGRSGKPVVITCNQIDDLDSLPPIDWTLLDKFNSKEKPFLFVPYYASRGCPFNCRYCCDMTNLNELGYKKKWRPKSVNSILEELRELLKYIGNKRPVILFADPIFGLKKKWKMELLGALCDLMRDRQDILLWFEERIDTFSDESVEYYSRMNSLITLGFESGSPDVLKLMNKTNHIDSYLKRALEIRDLFEKHKIYYNMNVLFGFPGESKENRVESQRFISELFKETSYGFPMVEKYMFFPGAPVYTTIMNSGDDETPNLNNIKFPDWYKKIGNVKIFSQLIDPAENNSVKDMMLQINEWVQDLFNTILKNFASYTGRQIAKVIKYTYLERSRIEWKYRSSLMEMVLNEIDDYAPQSIPVGDDFYAFIKKSETMKDPHLEKMKEIYNHLRSTLK